MTSSGPSPDDHHGATRHPIWTDMTRTTARRRILSLALAAALSGSVTAQTIAPFEPFTVTDIRVDGLQRISAGTVFSYLPVERGDVLVRTRSTEAIRALFK